MTEQEFEAFLERNGKFHEQVAEALSRLAPGAALCEDLAQRFAYLSAEYGAAAFVLISGQLCAPGYTLLRTQFETLVRGIWCLYAADDGWLEKLSQPLREQTAESASNALMPDKMLKGLRSSSSAPAALLDQLDACKAETWKALNSYSHGGFHPLARLESGYPPRLSYDVLRNSNAMLALAAQLAVIASGNPQDMIAVRRLHHEFSDCLPIIGP